MPTWLTVAFAVLAAVGIIGAWVERITDRQTAVLERLWRANIQAAIAEHGERCPARGRAVGAPEDDSGAVESARVQTPSGELTG